MSCSLHLVRSERRPQVRRRRLVLPAFLSLPDAVPGFPQANCQFHSHLPRAFVWHRVIQFVELRQQSQPEFPRIPVRLDASLVLVETDIGINTRHAYIDKGHTEHVIRIRAPETRFVPDHVGQFDHVDVVVVIPWPSLWLSLWLSLFPKRHA